MNTPENTPITDTQTLTTADVGVVPTEIVTADTAAATITTDATTSAPAVEETAVAVDPLLAAAAEAVPATDASAVTDVTFTDLTAEELAAAEAQLAQQVQDAAAQADEQEQAEPVAPSKIAIVYNGAKYAVAAIVAARLLGGAEVIDSSAVEQAVLDLKKYRVAIFLNVNPNEKWGKVAAAMMSGGNPDQTQCAIFLVDVAADQSDDGAIEVMNNENSLFFSPNGYQTILFGCSNRNINPVVSTVQILIRGVTGKFLALQDLTGFPYEQVFQGADQTVLSNVKVLAGESVFAANNPGLTLEPAQSLLVQLEALGNDIGLINQAISRPYAFEGSTNNAVPNAEGTFIGG